MATSKKKLTGKEYGKLTDSRKTEIRVVAALKGDLPAIYVRSKAEPRLDLQQAKNLRNALNAFIQAAMTGQA